jgi:Zn-dependent peptidase ImmA (M78 family)
MSANLYSIAEKEGIIVDFYEFPSAVLLGAYYRRGDNPPVILLHKKIEHRHRLLRCIFAEELGHHFTTGFDLMAFARTDKEYIVRKYEKLAIFWAVEYLMPLDKLIGAVNSGLFLTHEIAEFFNVTERFAGTGIKLYFEKRRDAMLKLLKNSWDLEY